MCEPIKAALPPQSGQLERSATDGALMPRTHLPQTVALTTAAFCAAGAAQAADPMAAVAWLSGCWVADGKEAGSGEMWLSPAGGTMLGVGRTVKAGKTAEFEFMQIRVNPEGKLVYIALPSGQRETAFVLASSAQDEVVFENPTHDFPQRVIYRRTAADAMTARIEGLRKGVVRGIDFPMRRSACELAK